MYWTLESWGADYPPENAEEIIRAANAMIDAYAENHDEYETEYFSERLWDRYCTTGTLPEI